MTTTPLLQAADRALARLDRAGAVLERAPTSGVVEVLDVLPSLATGDWTAVAAHVAARAPEVATALDDWEAWRAAASSAGEAVERLRAASWTPPDRRPSWPAERAALVERLVALGRTAAAAAAAADAMGATTIDDVAGTFASAVQAWSAGLAAAGEAIADASQALLLLDLAASFHVVPPARGRVALRPLDVAGEHLDESEARFWTAVRGAQLGAAGRALAAEAVAQVAPLTTVAARLAAARATSPARLVDEAIRAGDLLRRALHLAAVGRAAQVAQDPERWARAEALPVLARRDEPLDVAPPPVDGERVTLRGVLEEVTLTHRGPMAVSTGRFLVGGEPVTLLSTHIKLDSGGFVPGAAAVVGGRWVTRHPDVPGPALFLRRDQVAANAGRERGAWLLQRTRYVYVPVPHRFAVRSSVQPGRGVAGPLLYGTFAADPRSNV